VTTKQTATTKRHIEDPQWLRGVRDDLDSDPAVWAVQTKAGSISKLEALGRYLDTILTELGVPHAHACVTCGKKLREMQ
jgi:hypothetical protein